MQQIEIVCTCIFNMIKFVINDIILCFIARKFHISEIIAEQVQKIVNCIVIDILNLIKE